MLPEQIHICRGGGGGESQPARGGHQCEEEGQWLGSSPAAGIAAVGPHLLGGGMGSEAWVVREAERWHHRGRGPGA
jgi:hypothetical protein